MLLSCKISHSILTFLDRHGADLDPLFESGEFPVEFVRDPSYWLEAPLMENLLELLLRQYGHLTEGSLPTAAGHACRELRGWGVLDSVLRMVSHPKDLYNQPERFLGYFVSPAPPIGNVHRENACVSFDLPLDITQYPLSFQYLKAALEALPTYMDQPHARVSWHESHIEIQWQDDQNSLFGAPSETGDRQIHPELIEAVMQDLHSGQNELEAAKRALREKDAELSRLRGQLAQIKVPNDTPAVKTRVKSEMPLPLQVSSGVSLALPKTVACDDVVQGLFRLQDYNARAQQLITLLIGQGRNTAQVQEAMRRVDWPYVQLESPRLLREMIALLQTNSAAAASTELGAPLKSSAQDTAASAPTSAFQH